MNMPALTQFSPVRQMEKMTQTAYFRGVKERNRFLADFIHPSYHFSYTQAKLSLAEYAEFYDQAKNRFENHSRVFIGYNMLLKGTIHLVQAVVFASIFAIASIWHPYGWLDGGIHIRSRPYYSIDREKLLRADLRRAQYSTLREFQAFIGSILSCWNPMKGNYLFDQSLFHREAYNIHHHMHRQHFYQKYAL